MAYSDALGLSLGEVPAYRTGVRLVSPYFDLAGAYDARSRRSLRTLAWLRSWLGAQQPHFNWTDPMPALKEWWGISRGVLRRALPFPGRS